LARVKGLSGVAQKTNKVKWRLHFVNLTLFS
jgi:hypothetical protein